MTSAGRICPQDAGVLGCIRPRNAHVPRTHPSSGRARPRGMCTSSGVLRTRTFSGGRGTRPWTHPSLGCVRPRDTHVLWTYIRGCSVVYLYQRKWSGVAGESNHGHGGDDAGCGLWAIVAGQRAVEQARSSIKGAPQQKDRE